MITREDIEAMHPEYGKPICSNGDSLLGLRKVIKTLEGYLDTGTKASMGYAAKWHVSGTNRKGARD